MNLLLQDIVVTSLTLAVAVGAIVRLVKWGRPTGKPTCSNCNACAERTRPSASTSPSAK